MMNKWKCPMCGKVFRSIGSSVSCIGPMRKGNTLTTHKRVQMEAIPDGVEANRQSDR